LKVLILSYFDTHTGPEVFLVAPETFPREKLRHLTNFLDLEGEKFFLHEFSDYTSVNLKFELKNQFARGGIESLMISILLVDEEPETKVLKEILKSFVKDFKNIKGVAELINIHNENLQQNSQKLTEVKNFFFSFYESLPKETIYVKRKNANLFIFGLNAAGKTTIINRIKKNVFSNPKPTTGINVIKLLFQNLKITAYDAGGQKQYRKIWRSHLENQDGLIFVLDIVDEKRFKEARIELHRVINLPAVKDIPLLVLFNKVDKKKADKKILSKVLELNKIKDRKIKVFLTSAKTNEGITEAFNWIALEMLDRLLY